MNRIWRIASWLILRNGLCCTIGHILEKLNYAIYSNHIPACLCLGDNTVFEHHGLGTVVHDKVVIGRNCKIFQNVTIGAKWPQGSQKDGVPTIGDNVQIGCGAAILGDVHVGNNVYIGANAVVLTDIPDNSIAVGVPAKVISTMDK